MYLHTSMASLSKWMWINYNHSDKAAMQTGELHIYTYIMHQKCQLEKVHGVVNTVKNIHNHTYLIYG